MFTRPIKAFVFFLLSFLVMGCSANKMSVPGTVPQAELLACGTPTSLLATGAGTSDSPYLLQTVCDLQTFAANQTYWNASLRLMTDLDLENISFTPMIAFSGTFDGNHHSIVNWTGQNALFVTNSGSIQNLGLQNVTIQPAGAARPATLVGTNLAQGSVSHCTASGSVNGVISPLLDMDNDIYWFAGGLVSINAGLISNSSAAVAITGFNSLGGLVGYNNGGTINNSSASGSVKGMASPAPIAGQALGDSDGTEIGGLVGTHSAGTISNCTASGSVTGMGKVGNLVGNSLASVQSSTATGAISISSANTPQ